MMRSNDIWTGLPYDIVYFTLLQKLVADALGKEYGTYTHFTTSLHLYDKDEVKIRAALDPEREINKFYIDHKKLCENAKYLFQVATKDNIVRISKQKGVLVDED
jgi:thymidylate synthase